MQWKGYAGRLLRIDLSSRKFEIQPLDEDVMFRFVGGRGLAIKTLFDEMKAGTDPLGPDNPLIFVNGPLALTPAQSFTRWIVATKSPLTGTYMRSTGGGRFAQGMKQAGYDGIVVEGISEIPVVVEATEDGARFHNAGNIWGLETNIAQDEVRKLVQQPKAAVACIGPAGERMISFASIVSDYRTASRGGVGAVMGSKRLKALAVHGGRTVTVANPERFKEIVARRAKELSANHDRKELSRFGTTGADYMNEFGVYPTRNFQKGRLPEVGEVSQANYMSIRVKDAGCSGCMVKCSKLYRVASGRYAGAECEGPEYETIWAFSGPVERSDIGLTVAANRYCDDQGMDTISCGNAIGFLTELSERGLVGRQELGDLQLGWGRSDATMRLLEMIAKREGIGALLGRGVRAMAKEIGAGSERYAIHAKGLELAAYEPRAAKALGLNNATSNVGANHCMGYSAQELYHRKKPFEVDALSTDRKGLLTKYNQDNTSLLETGIACLFFLSNEWLDAEAMAEYLPTLTGIEAFGSVDYLWQVGERITNLERVYNVREGLGRKDDTLPARIVEEPLKDGPADGQIFELAEMLDQYYDARGWDKETGWPTPDTLTKLSLPEALPVVTQEMK